MAMCFLMQRDRKLIHARVWASPRDLAQIWLRVCEFTFGEEKK